MLADFERPLNKRGRHDAPRIAALLAQRGIAPDRVLCSTANRAQQTLHLMRRTLSIDDSVVEWRADLYLAAPETLLKVISQQDDAARELMIVAHNPGLEELANLLSSEPVGHVPTACIVRLAFDCEDWALIEAGQGRLEFVIRPRELMETS